MFWRLIISLALSFLYQLLAPTPPAPKASKTISGIPEAEEGTEPPVARGTVIVPNAQVAWWGHRKTKAIQK